MKIIFYHNTLAVYHIPFFQELSRRVNLKIVFTNMGVGREVYGEQIPTERLGQIAYECLKRNFKIAGEIYREIKVSGNAIVNLPTPDGIYELVICYLCLFFSKVNHRKTVILWIRWVPDRRFISRKQRIKTAIRNLVVKPIVKNTDICICSGRKSYENFVNLGAGRGKIRQIHYGTDVNIDSKECDIVSQYHLPENKKVILYFGRVVRRKGLMYLIQAFERCMDGLADFCLVIAGEGAGYLDECKRYVSDLGIRDVFFAGLVPTAFRAAFFSYSSIFVLPSLCDVRDREGGPEPWGQTVVEALQCGCFVIATDAVGAAYEVLDGENGIMVEQGSVESMAKGLCEAALKKKDRKRIMDSAANYTAAAMAEDFTDIYKKLME